MLRSFAISTCLVGLLTTALSAQITIVDDNFESYADDFEFWFDWEPAAGNGSVPAPPEAADAGILTTDSEMFPGIEGQAVAHIGGGINQWFPLTFFDPLNEDDVLEPTEEHSIQFGGDLFVPHGNTRLTIGLRSNAPANILEIGAYNEDLRGLGYRLQLFGEGNVNWGYFDLPSEFDEDEDGTVTYGEIGPAWHRFQATVTPTDVTFEVDAFRDGTIDAMSVVEATPHEAMFDSFRIGGPSGVGSAGEGAFDNVFLRLIEAEIGGEPIPGDYNDNGRVEQADLDLVLLNWNTDNIPPTWVNQRPESGIVDQAELDGVLLNWNRTTPGLGTAAAVPEPGTWILLALAGVAALAFRR